MPRKITFAKKRAWTIFGLPLRRWLDTQFAFKKQVCLGRGDEAGGVCGEIGLEKVRRQYCSGGIFLRNLCRTRAWPDPDGGRT
jgi:hypothetical protein